MAPRKAAVAYIHIGLEKTGTTSIQDVLHRASEPLKNQGVFVANQFNPKNNLGFVALALPPKVGRNFLAQQGKDADAEMATYQHAYANLLSELEAANCTKLVVSSEHLSSWVCSLDAVSQLRELLYDIADNVKIIVYLRRQDRLAQSLVSEFVKSGGEIRDGRIIDVFNPTNSKLQLTELVETYINVFGRKHVIVRAFERRSFIKGNLLEDFFAQIGDIAKSL